MSASIVINDSEVAIFWEGKDVEFYQFLYCVLFIDKTKLHNWFLPYNTESVLIWCLVGY